MKKNKRQDKKNITEEERKSVPFTGVKYLILLLTVTTVLYMPSLKNEFNNWDDDAYILSNPNIELSKDNIKKSFLQGEYHRMYAPLTALSHSIVYHYYRLLPKPYILVNLILHLCNVALMFYFISLISRNSIVPFFTAALFALHPMQVESVAYAAGRRDVLYVFFYLLCIISYIMSLNRKKGFVIYYVLSLLFALLALLSKGQAITLPAVIILVSLFLGHKWNRKSFWPDKLPFVILSAIIAYKVFSAPQFASGGFADTSYLDVHTPLFKRMIYACYGFIQYIILLVAPYKLSLVHAYPRVHGEYVIPLSFYFYVLLLAGLMYYFIRYALKDRVVWFGLSFFAINIVMLLQIIPNSYGIMNDHYVYFASAGIFFLITEKAVTEFPEKKNFSLIVGIFIFCASMFVYLTYKRIPVFKNSLTVWTDVINKYPWADKAYDNRAVFYMDKMNDDEKALSDYNKTLELNPVNSTAYDNRGMIYSKRGLFEKAMADFNNALKYNPKYYSAYCNRGKLYSDMGNDDLSIKDYNTSIQLNPNYSVVYNNRGAIHDKRGEYDLALADFSKAIKLNPSYYLAYCNRGKLYGRYRQFDLALHDFSTATDLNPSAAESWFYRAMSERDLGKTEEAKAHATKAIQLGMQLNDTFLQSLGMKK